jgi:hypothetical protein
MRKLMLVFLMLFLPLQWTAALAADCCLRHDAQTQEHHAAQMDHAQMHGDHHEHHAKAEKSDDGKTDSGKQVKLDCDMGCGGCLAHHCAAAVSESLTIAAGLPAMAGDTPYLSRITAPVPDNLYRPPLSSLV